MKSRNLGLGDGLMVGVEVAVASLSFALGVVDGTAVGGDTGTGDAVGTGSGSPVGVATGVGVWEARGTTTVANFTTGVAVGTGMGREVAVGRGFIRASVVIAVLGSGRVTITDVFRVDKVCPLAVTKADTSLSPKGPSFGVIIQDHPAWPSRTCCGTSPSGAISNPGASSVKLIRRWTGTGASLTIPRESPTVGG